MADFNVLGFHDTNKVPVLPSASDVIVIPKIAFGTLSSHVEVSASAAELNILDGVTASTAEINILAGVSATTAEINVLDGVTASTAEINILDGVSASTAELNILDGVTSTTAELNILDGVTATTAELNILDGVTSTATELNILDGVTATTAELNILDGVTSTAAELNLVDGSSAGTIVNSKAAIYGSSGELNATTLQIAGTSISATAAEINVLDGVTASTGELNILDGVTASTAEINLLDGVTATTTELNYVDVTTIGRASASKALVVDSNKEIRDIRNLIIDGDLTVGGTTTTVNSTTVTIDDPIFTLGGDTAPSSDDNKDRGIEFRYHDGSAAKVGFFGLDDSTGRFTFIPNASNNSEVFSGDVGNAEFKRLFLSSGGLSLNNVQVTSTAAELNVLDGITASTAELNILTGVTSTASELNILDGVTATATEINRLDLTSGAGPTEANKVVTADASGDTKFVSGTVEIGDGSTGRNLSLKNQSAIVHDGLSFAAGSGSAANVSRFDLLAISSASELARADCDAGSFNLANVCAVAMEDGPTAASAAVKLAAFSFGHPTGVKFISSDTPGGSDVGAAVYLSATAGQATLTAPSASGTRIVRVGFLLNSADISGGGNVYQILFQPQLIAINP